MAKTIIYTISYEIKAEGAYCGDNCQYKEYFGFPSCDLFQTELKIHKLTQKMLRCKECLEAGKDAKKQ